MDQKRVGLYSPSDIPDQGITAHLKCLGITPKTYHEKDSLRREPEDTFAAIIIVAGQDFPKVTEEVGKRFTKSELIAHDPGRDPAVLDLAKEKKMTVLDPADHLNDLSRILGGILGRPLNDQEQTLPRVLVVEDNNIDREDMCGALKQIADVSTAQSLDEAMEYLSGTVHLFAVVIADLHLPKEASSPETDPENGLRVLEAVRRKSVATRSIVVTGHHGEDETYVHHHSALYRQGAISFLSKKNALEKPKALEEPNALETEVQRAITEYQELIARQAILRTTNSIDFDWIIARDERVLDIIDQIRRIAQSDGPAKTHPILMTGGTGTGKELLARSFATAKKRTGPFVSINCADIARDGGSTMTMQLFGAAAKFFTDVKASDGILAEAKNGTVFLDEIQALSREVQDSLLSVMENDCLPAINGLPEREKIDIQFIVATNEPEKLTIDLRNRISTAKDIPTLRERTDLDYLVDFFVHAVGQDRGVVISGVDADAMARLQEYSWPGNIRQLYYVIGRIVDNSLWQRNDGRIRLPDVDAVLFEEYTKYSSTSIKTEDVDDNNKEQPESPDESADDITVETEAHRWLERIMHGEHINHLEILEAPGVPGLSRDERKRFGWELYLRVWDLLDERRKRLMGQRSNRDEFIKKHTGLVDSNGAALNGSAVGKMLNDARKKLNAADGLVENS
jgi:DNA-binding NtrC family response regulator